MIALPRKYQDPRYLTIAIVVGLVLLLEAGVRGGVISPLIITAPTAIFSSLIVELQTSEVQKHIIRTVFRIFTSFTLALVIGVTLSIVLWQNETLRSAYLPMFGALFGTPIILLYLVSVAIFGRGDAAIIAISVLPGSIPMIINTTDALATVEKTYVEVAKDFNAGREQILSKVIFPAAAPDIFAGIRIGFTYVVVSVIATEFLLVINTGLGGMISNEYYRYNISEMYVGIILVILIVATFISVFKRAEERIRR